ncbi:MAG: hypothetical protein JRG82_14705 [Deltaproteobacteria bacterium]|nr:hypothetical protein [Deltaproteobacteria bacterium]
MKTLFLALLAVALWTEPGAARAAEPLDPTETAEESPSGSDRNAADEEDAADGEESASGEEGASERDDYDEDEEDAEAADKKDPPPADMDEDDLVEVRGLVFEFYVADDSQVTQLAIEAPDRDYMVSPGKAAEALAEQLGKTVRAQGWPVPDDAGDIWLALDTFEVTD